jgi:CRISPR/Cas system CSM-associated protein Csm2 small subunit
MLAYFRAAMIPFYDNVTFVGGPETEGKRPYFYVLGPTGTEPLAQGKLDDAGVKAGREAIAKGKAQMAKSAKWQKFYGTADPAHFPSIAKAIEKGKPLGPVATAIQKDVLSKDAEKAREAQVAYDALSQTRSDLLFRITLEARACPHRAYYDFQQLVKFWPSEKKKLDDVMARLKAIPDAEKLSKMFCKAMTWSEPDFECKNAGEAKKIVAELKKMKTQLAKMKESKVIVVQNGALLLDSQIDTLVETIPDRVAGK